MESWIQRIFLIGSLVGTVTLASNICQAQEDEGEFDDEKTILDAIIEPDLERRTVEEDQIDTENFEVGFYSGVMSFEDFGSNNVFGYRLAYHISEDWFLEGAYGITELGETSAESLFNLDLLGDEREAKYYNMSLGVNLFPGEIFLGEKYAFNTDVYLILGAGSTEFADDEFFTYNFGGGFRLYATDWLAFRLDFRHHIFTHNILGNDKSIQNLEADVGLSLFF
ncbi:hypothetical protein TDB9533_01837 [Thalassocella blandensis]|nr:hypothetical protein TDB9533_01837 [Thalassocella blandensis]